MANGRRYVEIAPHIDHQVNCGLRQQFFSINKAVTVALIRTKSYAHAVLGRLCRYIHVAA
jgi:hypothetical protein